MSISMRKINAIVSLKTKLLMKNMQLMAAPVMAVGFTVIMKMVLGEHETGGDEFVASAYYLQLGLMFSSLLGGTMGTGVLIAEEKEKNTLRVLMTSSISGIEYFIGSFIPVLVVFEAINVLLLYLSGANHIPLLPYILYTTCVTLISMMFGAVVGLIAKSQSSAGTLMIPFMMPMLMIPIFSQMNDTFATISRFLFTGALSEILFGLETQGASAITFENILVLLAWLLLSLVILLWYYKKNGFEKD